MEGCLATGDWRPLYTSVPRFTTFDDSALFFLSTSGSLGRGSKHDTRGLVNNGGTGHGRLSASTMSVMIILTLDSFNTFHVRQSPSEINPPATHDTFHITDSANPSIRLSPKQHDSKQNTIHACINHLRNGSSSSSIVFSLQKSTVRHLQKMRGDAKFTVTCSQPPLRMG